MKLKELINPLSVIESEGNIDLDIDKIVYDSREAGPKSLFVCIKGFETDGHLFIDDAAAAGTRAVIIEKKLDHYRKDLTYIRVKDSRHALSKLGNIFYNYPLEEIELIGITGTNGKTTTTYLIKSILEEAGCKTGLIGTIQNFVDNKIYDSSRTTPESLDLYRLFREMADSNVDYAVMEVSSHALDLKRVAGMEFITGVFTNITQDHLDYHQSIDNYVKAKSKLFRQIKEEGQAVINIDDDHSQDIIEAATGELVTYSMEDEANYMADNVELSAAGVNFEVLGDIEVDIELRLAGRFNVYNALASIATASSLGVEEEDIKTGLEEMDGVPGRFELVDRGQDFAVVVDYAHTPDGMENVLETAEEITAGEIIIVFGCGGDRDRKKRPLMAQIAAKYGDFSILTTDNPRSEEPMKILAEIEAGMKSMNEHPPYRVIEDREQAIKEAINRAETEDMVIIFGKGHETYQVFKDRTIDFDDRKKAAQALMKLRDRDSDNS